MRRTLRSGSAGRRHVLLGLAAAAVLAPMRLQAASLPTVAIIGTGRVGAAIGPRLAQKGYRVIYGSRSPGTPHVAELVARSGPNARAAAPAEAAREAAVIIFAVPWTAAEEAIKSLGDLRGKVVLDTTNPVIVDKGKDTAVPVNTSGAQMIQSWAPTARVVKALNTTNWSVMADPGKSSGRVTIPLAGDDPAAKEASARLVKDLDFDAFDTGPLANARQIEAMALLYISMLLQDRPDAAEFALLPRKK